jgi:hypothetical protein
MKFLIAAGLVASLLIADAQAGLLVDVFSPRTTNVNIGIGGRSASRVASRSYERAIRRSSRASLRSDVRFVERNSFSQRSVLRSSASCYAAPQSVVVQSEPVIVQQEPIIIEQEPIIIQQEPVIIRQSPQVIYGGRSIRSGAACSSCNVW